jgi:hypothetical protein
MAVALAHLYPKLKGLAVFFIVLVASARVLFNAHYLYTKSIWRNGNYFRWKYNPYIYLFWQFCYSRSKSNRWNNYLC